MNSEIKYVDGTPPHFVAPTDRLFVPNHGVSPDGVKDHPIMGIANDIQTDTDDNLYYISLALKHFIDAGNSGGEAQIYVDHFPNTVELGDDEDDMDDLTQIYSVPHPFNSAQWIISRLNVEQYSIVLEVTYNGGANGYHRYAEVVGSDNLLKFLDLCLEKLSEPFKDNTGTLEFDIDLN